MNAITIFFIILSTVAVCIIIFQLYSIYLNYDNIKEFNSAHSAFEFSKSVNTLSLDRTIKDPNDDIYDPKQKWRCVKLDNDYVSVSMFGFKSNGSEIRKFKNLESCIDYTFSQSTHSDIKNPCILQNGIKSKECIFLKSMF
ncbi:hypothetical protein [Lumpy skin disease virus]|uniref:Envelope protein A28 homolog n=5 Tax=Capripoxvirus TaxID=10265 RepID=A28_LSDV|nr:LSDV118 hypothetical protein [Lumpy skin disease virus NI-2490]NP_659690.1 hypothetical protein SPPV_113 [Sheeppox virus]P16718.1 RecName: Full=Envelope protein A28 homolog; AltName: Full=Protein HM3 [Sheeppox virus KS-1]Q8JTR0.2 RecName: Full=Envelope protein A28 homolog; AltName: Full=Protein LSDV118 [Lumpy skin disease virus NI-2490]AAN02686.1 hypothetical protein [Lumpy skin disease virus NW-LW]AOE47694.1 hypothetical protein [Lumpy skin disease virus]AXA19878.1 hypothetical protein [G